MSVLYTANLNLVALTSRTRNHSTGFKDRISIKFVILLDTGFRKVGQVKNIAHVY